MTQHQDDDIRKILSATRVIAVVGISPNADRPSHEVAHFLQSKGYRIVPVNPGQAGGQILGELVYADLAAIPDEIAVDMVDIFRRSEAVPEVVEAALRHLPGLRTIWMQLGVAHEAAAATARARGVTVVMDHCPKIEYPRVMART
ncbi:CoA-binding protein [Phaeovulum sp.]|uniref:CoA-binding protein n=1 Tax=Phaeovulum sp. TaxID=2934796 RepID=UPI0039E2DEFC